MNDFNFRVASRASGNLGPNSGNTATLLINSFKTKYINGNAGGKTNVLRIGGRGEATPRASVKTIVASPEGGEFVFQIQSYKEKLINGKASGEISSVTGRDIVAPVLPNWLHTVSTKDVTISGKPGVEITMRADANNNVADRSSKNIYTQSPSGKTVTITVTQESNLAIVNYTFSSDTQQQTFTFGYNGNLTKSFIITSYVEYNNGSKVFMPINVSSLPPWITVNQTQDGVSNVYQRKITITLAANTGAQRNYAITFTQQQSTRNFTLIMLQYKYPSTIVNPIRVYSSDKLGESGAYDLYEIWFEADSAPTSRLTINYLLGYGTTLPNGNQSGEVDIIAGGGNKKSATVSVRCLTGNNPELRDGSVTPNSDNIFSYTISFA